MQASTENAALSNAAMTLSESGWFKNIDNFSFKQLADQAPVIMWITDVNAECVFLNRLWYEYTGQSPAAGLEKGWLNVVHPDDRVATNENFLQGDRNHVEFSLEYRLRAKNGDYRWMLDHGSPIFDEASIFQGYIGTVIDINDRKLAEENAKANERKYSESESRFRKLVHVLPVAVYVADATGSLEVVNNEALRMWGYNGELQNVKWCGAHRVYNIDGIEVLPEDFPIRKAFREQRAFVEEAIIEKPNGELVFVISYPQPIYNNANECVGAMSVAVDITDIKHTENELQRLMADLEKRVDERTSELKHSNDELMRTNLQLEQYAYVASHDLQEPLRKIKVFINILKENMHNPDILKTYLSKIDLSAQRMSSLIQDVLNYSRLLKQNSEFIDVDLNIILNDVLVDFELLIEQKHAIIKSDHLPVLKGNPLQLTQLFSNLVSNSLKFNDNNPVIEIKSVLIKKNQDALLHLNPVVDYVEIQFIDNGIGFNEKYIEQIFGIFQRLNQRQQFTGTGIGLALCKKIAENHKGMITACSQEGLGSTFKVYLPLDIPK